MNDGFYRAFEERYYAPRSVIKELRRQYLPFIEPLTTVYPEAQTYDAGCGRGEWLELMLERGFSPIGVDLDEGMLEACRENNLPGRQGDAVQQLLDFEDCSLAVVSAFHVLEHIDFDALRRFVQHAWRTLKPGGLLIMETPNPENLVVATRNFYLDPTHQKPIPSELLAFVAEFAGFERVKTVRLQEAKELITKDYISMTELLGGASPDYAVVAQKAAEPELMSLFDSAFERDFGISLETLAARVDRGLKDAQVKIKQSQQSASEAAARAIEAEAKINALLNSRSWRLTAPIRGIAQLLKDGMPTSGNQLKLLLQHVFLYINRRPRLKRLVSKVIARFPRLRTRLAGIFRQRVLYETSEFDQVPLELQHLAPHARRIHRDLEAAIEKNRIHK